MLLANSNAQVLSQLHSLERAAGGIGPHVNADKREYMCFYQRGDMSTLNGGPLKHVDKFLYLGSNVSSTENGINIRLAEAWATIDMEVKLVRLNKTQFFGFFKYWSIEMSWRQHPTTQQLYGSLLTITKTIQIRRTRHAGHCWRSRANSSAMHSCITFFHIYCRNLRLRFDWVLSFKSKD